MLGLGWLKSSDIKPRAVLPEHEGLFVQNKFAGSLTAGMLVYVNGVNTTAANAAAGLGLPTITKADADATAPANVATYVVVETIPQDGFGKVARAYTQLNVDTSSWSAAGDPAYLSATAGESTATAPSGTVQRVGYVRVKSSTVGVIDYFLRNSTVTSLGSPVTFGAGTFAAPSVSFTLDPDTGFLNPAANVIGLALGGAPGLSFGITLPTSAAAVDTAGASVFVRTADAGASATAARVGGSLAFVAGAGSAGSSGTGTVAAGAGGDAANRTSGAGGASTSSAGAAGGNGGAIADATGAGGSAAGTSVAGRGGDVVQTTGAGGAKSGTGTANGGRGGNSTRTMGDGGTTASTNAGSVGGTGGGITDTCGNGGAVTAGTGNGGAGGAYATVAGNGGVSAGGVGGAGGTNTSTAGTGGVGTAGNGGAGGAAGIMAGGGGNSTAVGNGGVGGSVPLQPGMGGTGVAPGANGIVYVKGNAPMPFCENVVYNALADADVTLSDAQHRGTVLSVAVGATNRTLTTRTAAQLVAAFPGVQIGSMIPLRVLNLKAANTVTVAVGGGVTAAGSLVVAATAAATFGIIFTNVTSSSEAATIVRMAG